MAEVKVVGLWKRFGDVEAVKGITFEVKEGEFAVMLGPSGCGKTTTLRCIAGLERPDEGDILFNGRRVNELRPSQRNIAFVFQFYALYPHLTVWDNIAFPLKAEKLPKEEIRRRVEEVLEMLDLKGLERRKPKELSAGQKQRVALGRAMVRRPEVFLLDEPLSNLDAKLRERMRGELKKLQRKLGATTIYVTHDQIEAMSMADKIIVMNEGKIQQIGTPHEVYHNPANLFVANFIGSPGMNFIRCRYDREGGRLRDESGGIEIPLSEIAREKLGSISTDEVIIGVRPEAIEFHPGPSPRAIEAGVYLVEPLGSVNVVNLEVGGEVIKAVAEPGFSPSVDEKVWISFKEVSLFDGRGGDSIGAMGGEELWRR
ncbi:ABC transporter ATP-binding protein [Candidatus Poribacteria bacterium]|nr:MAG: ABC transporter ATP-binding protein [Candidatus Poribacteria bacterium]